MKKGVFLSIFLIGIIGISGCVTASNPLNGIQTDAKYFANKSVNSAKYYQSKYIECLAYSAGIEIANKRSLAYDKQAAINYCRKVGQEFYEAVFRESFRKRPDVLKMSNVDVYKHNTARLVLINAQKEAFSKIEKTWIKAKKGSKK